MRIIEPYFEILDELDGKKMLQKIIKKPIS